MGDLHVLGAYYKWVVLLLMIIIFCKLLLSWLYYGSMRGVIGIFYAIFTWHNQYQFEVVDDKSLLKYMRLQNFLSVVMYLIMALMVAIFFVSRFLVR